MKRVQMMASREIRREKRCDFDTLTILYTWAMLSANRVPSSVWIMVQLI